MKKIRRNKPKEQIHICVENCVEIVSNLHKQLENQEQGA